MTPTDGQVLTWDNANSRWDAAGVPAAPLTRSTLTHTGGEITLDTQAADVYQFGADTYSAGAATQIVGSANGGTTTITKHASTVEGDLLLLFAYGGYTLPAGFTQIYLTSGPNSSTTGTVCGYRFVEAGDTTWTMGDATAWVTLTLRGPIVSNFLDDFSDAVTGLSKTAYNTNPATVGDDTGYDALAIVHLNYRDTDAVPPDPNPPSGYTVQTWGRAGSNTWTAAVMTKSVPSDPTGSHDPGDGIAFGDTIHSYNARTMIIAAAAAGGEKDYTITFSNLPGSGIEKGEIDFEVTTTAGSVTFAGGTTRTWIGYQPSFNKVGTYKISYWCDSTDIYLTYEGGPETSVIEALADVNAMTPTDGQVLTWDNANSRWDALDAAGGAAINDAATNTTEAWSSNKIQTELDLQDVKIKQARALAML